MSEKEMMERIKQLEQENMRLKNGKIVANIIGSMNNQAELDFIYPHFSTYKGGEWTRSTVGNFVNLRKLAMSVIDKVDEKNNFTEQKVKELSKEDLILAVDCADEIAKVVAKYKKQYLERNGRKDIVEAYGM